LRAIPGRDSTASFSIYLFPIDPDAEKDGAFDESSLTCELGEVSLTETSRQLPFPDRWNRMTL
jgi:hypothetical protein